VRPDEEVGQHAGLGAATLAVVRERPPGQIEGSARYFDDFDARDGERGIEFLDPQEGRCEFGVNDAVDDQAILERQGFQLTLRPFRPMRIDGHDIEQNVGIDEDQGSVVAAHQGHDFVGGHVTGRCAAYLGERTFLGARLAAAFDEHDFTLIVQAEFDLAAGRDAQPVTHLLGNGDLALAGDGGAHEKYYL